MKLLDFVSKDALTPALKATERDEALSEMVDLLIGAGAAPKNLRDDLMKLILDRENHGSTGFGKGVAVPHVKHEKIKKMTACVAVSPTGIEYGALDKAPVYALVMLFSPKDKPRGAPPGDGDHLLEPAERPVPSFPATSGDDRRNPGPPPGGRCSETQELSHPAPLTHCPHTPAS